DTQAWTAALTAAGLVAISTAEPDTALGQVRFTIGAPMAATTAKLDAAKLFAARVEPVTQHHQTTWSALKKSPGQGLDADGKLLPDAQIELVGIYVAHQIPSDAYVVVTGELPDDYWYVLPVTIGLGVIVLVFSWALIRALRRALHSGRVA